MKVAGAHDVHMLCATQPRHLGFNAWVGGNLGTPLSKLALQHLSSTSRAASTSQDSTGMTPCDVAVVEVSSYQLQLGDGFRADAGVVMNLTPDHLERHGSMQAYAAAKANAFACMSSAGLALIPAGELHPLPPSRASAHAIHPTTLLL